jgi:hypothetical protein
VDPRKKINVHEKWIGFYLADASKANRRISSGGIELPRIAKMPHMVEQRGEVPTTNTSNARCESLLRVALRILVTSQNDVCTPFLSHCMSHATLYLINIKKKFRVNYVHASHLKENEN